MAAKHSLASDFLPEFTCTPCSKEDNNKEAAWFCVECSEYYCDQCLKYHNRLGALIGHQVLDEEAFRQSKTSINTSAGLNLPTDKCRRHFNKLVDMYCEDHDMVSCSVCAALEHRPCEKVLYIPDIADDCLNGLCVQAVTCKLTETLVQIKDLKQDRLEHKTRLADERDSGLNSVEMRRRDINEYLDSLDATVNTKITDKHNEFSSKLAGDVKTCDEAIALLEDMNSRLQTSCNPSQSFVNIKQTEQTIKEIENEKEKCLKSNNDRLTISNEFLDELTVFLKKEFSRYVGKASLQTIDTSFQKSHNIKMNVDELTLAGKSQDVSLAEEYVTEFVKAKQECDKKKGSSDDNYEQHIIDRTLSKEISSKEHCKKLKNVRREVFMLLKVVHERMWMYITQDCTVNFDSGDVTIQCQDDDKLVEVYLFAKNKLSDLDDFHYCDLLSNRLAEDVLDAAKCVKDEFKDNDDVYVYEDDGMAKLASKSFERIDEFSRLVEIRMKGNQPSSRGNRQLAAVDEKVKSQSPIFERSFRNNPNASNSRTTTSPDIQTEFKLFKTDEGINVYVYKASILHLDVDCIVNAANSEMKHGGGIAKVIAQAAGPALENESRDFIRAHGKLSVGYSCVTTAGQLNYSRVIHTVGPCVTDYSKDEVDTLNRDLYDAIYSSLDEAKNCQLKSIGIPSVSSGVFGVPRKWCAAQYCLAVKCFSQLNWNSSLKEVHFIDIDEEMLKVIGLTCEVVFNSNTKSKKELDRLKCTTQENNRFQFRQKSKEYYPKTLKSTVSMFKIKLCADFQIAVRTGNIVDFEKGVIVCPQDPELRCLGGVAEAIKYKESYFEGNLRKRHTDKKYTVGEVLVSVCRALRCPTVYNVVVQRSRDMNVVNHCYTQVLQKADLNYIEKIALPLFCTDRGQDVEELARALASCLIELFNSKGHQHKFPSVYIYAYKRKSADIIVRVLNEVIMEKTDRAKTKSEDGGFPTIDSHSSSPEAFRREFKPRPSPKSEDCGFPSIDSHSSSPEAFRRDFKPRPSPTQQRPPANPSRSSQNSTDVSMESETEGRSLDDGAAPRTGTSEPERSGPTRPSDGTLESMQCVICVDSFTNPKTLSKCGHTFCTKCIDDYFKVKPVCPFCFTVYGVLTGTQPNGEMQVEMDKRLLLPGYERYGSIRIHYSFPDGTQGKGHPSPGQKYYGTHRTAYLPDTKEGRKVLKLLKLAFKRRLVFTIRRSVTTGLENAVTWNDIRHKTQIAGGSSNSGYPDPDYLTQVTRDLAAKGVTEADI